MNKLKELKQAQIISTLVEGNSLRATARMRAPGSAHTGGERPKGNFFEGQTTKGGKATRRSSISRPKPANCSNASHPHRFRLRPSRAPAAPFRNSEPPRGQNFRELSRPPPPGSTPPVAGSAAVSAALSRSQWSAGKSLNLSPIFLG